MKKTIVLLADGFEEIEALTFVDLLRRAEIETLMFSISGKHEVVGTNGIKVVADDVLSRSNAGLVIDADCIYLPGGHGGSVRLSQSSEVAEILEKRNKGGKLISAICAAPAMVLYPLGLLDGKKFTCYPSLEEGLDKGIYKKDNVVEDGNIVTSRGPGTAHLVAEKIIEKLKGKSTAEKVMEGTLFA